MYGVFLPRALDRSECGCPTCVTLENRDGSEKMGVSGRRIRMAARMVGLSHGIGDIKIELRIGYPC